MSFKVLIRKTLSISKSMSHSKIEAILENQKYMNMFAQAFTSITYDPINNYEYMEQIGDVSINKFLINYFYTRFPVLKCTLGVKVVARLKINYCSKKTFSQISEDLGFFEFINASDEEKQNLRINLLEDVLESFFGCLEQILDEKYHIGVGYAIIYDLLTSIFDTIPISLCYDDLYDAKTRLKELYDLKKSVDNLTGKQLGDLRYSVFRDDDSGIYTSNVFDTKFKCIGSGESNKKSEAEQVSAQNALIFLSKNKNIFKNVPIEYNEFRSGNREKGNGLSVIFNVIKNST